MRFRTRRTDALDRERVKVVAASCDAAAMALQKRAETAPRLLRFIASPALERAAKHRAPQLYRRVGQRRDDIS